MTLKVVSTDTIGVIRELASEQRNQFAPREGDILFRQLDELQQEPTRWNDARRYWPSDHHTLTHEEMDIRILGYTFATQPITAEEKDAHLTKRTCRFITDIHDLLATRGEELDDDHVVQPEDQEILMFLWRRHMADVHELRSNLWVDTSQLSDPSCFFRMYMFHDMILNPWR